VKQVLNCTKLGCLPKKWCIYASSRQKFKMKPSCLFITCPMLVFLTKLGSKLAHYSFCWPSV